MKISIRLFPYFLTIALCCFALHVQAQQPTESDLVEKEEPTLPLTEMTFEETTFDFGEIEAGEQIAHTFTFTNTGDQPLILSDAKGSCGCTVPRWPREYIAPGETASITVEFNSRNKKGKRNQRVTLTANTDPPQTFVFLTGSVYPNENEEILFNDDIIEEPVERAEIEEINPNCFAIYPNPTAELLQLDMEESIGEAAIISIYSKSGQLMAKREIDRIEGTIEFQVGHYPAGTYMANVQIAGKKAETKCFVVVE